MSRTLLCIDPDPAVRLLFRKVLAPAGFNVVDAGDPASGCRLAERRPPDVVVVDVDATATAPPDLARALRASPGMERAVFVASTADDEADRVATTTAGGFDLVLLKPLDVDDLPGKLGADVPVLGIRSPLRAGIDATSARRHRSLTVLTEKLVKRASVVDGRLALLDPSKRVLILAAACSLRPVGDPPPIGLKVPVGAVSWLQPLLDGRQSAMLDPEKLGASPLVPPESTAVLVVPIASEDVVYGVVILGERRRQAFAFPPAQVSATTREAARIASVLTEFDRLDEAIHDKRRAVERFRIEVTQLVSTAGRQMDPADADVADRAALRLLTQKLAERLSLSPAETENLRQAVEIYDVGRRWLQLVLFPHMELAEADRLAALDNHGEETAEMLTALGWSSAVVDVVRGYHACALRGDDAAPTHAVPLATRILAVTTAYRDLVVTLGRALDPMEVRRLLSGMDGAIVDALVDLIGDEPSGTGG